MSKLNLFAMFIATLFLCGCTRHKPISFVDEMFYLVSVDKPNSKYLQIECQFEKSKVKIFKMTDLHPMVGDVVIGTYSLVDNVLDFPIGNFYIKKTADGYNLYSMNKLKYRLSKKKQPYITAHPRQSQFASIIR
jgi:hypothetical protein